MIGIVLVTHGRLAAEFRAALEHVVGPQKQIETIAVGPDDNIEQRRRDIVSAVTKVDSGVVVLTDMFGGTPSNLAISIMNGSNIEVIAAVNLPMLIKLASVRETSSLEQAVIEAQDAGRRYICAASRILGAKPDRVDMPFDQVA
ncbi:MAG: PTS sugar transporter subunit IIA [Methylocella sp.]